MIYKNNRHLIGFGSNRYGQLGLGNMIFVYTPKIIMNDKDIKMVVCAYNMSIIYKNNADLSFINSSNEKCGKCLSIVRLILNDPSITKIYDQTISFD